MTRQKQLENNVNAILGLYENGMTDYGTEEYPPMTEDELVEYVTSQIYDMKDYGNGRTQYKEGICKELKFIGNKKIRETILTLASEYSILSTVAQDYDVVDVIIYTFTGMKIQNVRQAELENGIYLVPTKNGILKFDAKTLTQIECKNPKFANRIELA